MADPQERDDPFREFIDEILKPNKVDRDFAKDIQLQEVRNYVEANRLNLGVVRRWYEIPHDLNETNGDFDKFVEGCRDLVTKGDEIMMNVESTGFNIDRFDIFTDGFTSENDNPTIFYNCYLERPIHFALLLADMERLGLLDDVKVDFSCKATKVNWKWGESDSESKTKKMVRHDGTAVAIKSTMETVVRFGMDDWNKVPLILRYFEGHVFYTRDGRIPWSFEDPDIRILPDFVTPELNAKTDTTLATEIQDDFLSAIMNEFSSGKGKLLILRQRTSFSDNLEVPGWTSRRVVLNKELFDYLSADGVKP